MNAETNKIYQVGSIAHQIESTRENPQRYRVYLPCGIAPALNTAQGGGLSPYIVVSIGEKYDSNNRDSWK